MMKRTIPQLFQDSIKKHADRIFLWEKKESQFKGTTFTQIGEDVKKLTNALYDYGIKKGERIALLSEGRNDWIISEMAMFHLGAINVPLSVKIIEASELKFKINHSGSKLIIVSANQLIKIRKIKSELTLVEQIIVLDQIEKFEDKEVYLDEFIRTNSKQTDFDYQKLWQDVNEDDCATISYTSGTTAEPKGIMLSHRNYTANVEQAEGLFAIPAHYKTLLILPWDHSFAHTVGIFPLMKNGASLASIQIGKTPNETLKNIPVNMREIEPAFLLSVPALAKNFKKNIEYNIRTKGSKVENLFNKALNISYKYHRLGFDRGKGFSFLLKPIVAIFDKVLFSKVKEGFGGKLQFFVGGGALLDIELQKFFCAVGMPMYQGYGLTEAAPIISSNTKKNHKFGSSGKIAPNMECKILNEDGIEQSAGIKGEIVIKGENVMLGYWQNETATKETIIDGWLYTGDLGYLDKDGYLYVLGRFKSLLISQDGEKYSPEGIEESIVENSNFIDQIMLYNDHNPYTIALIAPQLETIKRHLKITNKELNPENILNILKSEIDKYYGTGEFGGLFPERWLPSSFVIVPEGFNEQNRLMNSTMKIVRGKITEHYKDLIDYVYSPEGKQFMNKKNKSIIENLIL